MATTAAALCLLLSAAPPTTMDDALRSFGKAHGVAFDRLKSVELSDLQTRITRFGAKGTPFQPKLDQLRKRQGEVSDLLLKATRLKQAGLDEKRVASVEAATAVLAEADTKALALLADVKGLDAELTKAGAPVLPPAPPRDPNARD